MKTALASEGKLLGEADGYATVQCPEQDIRQIPLGKQIRN